MRIGALVCAVFGAAIPCLAPPQEITEKQISEALKPARGNVQLPAGMVTLHHEIVIGSSAQDLTIAGDHTIFSLAPDFRGRAALVVEGAKNVRISGISVDGNRDRIRHPVQDIPVPETVFADFTPDNGILARKVSGLVIEKASFRGVAGFAVLVSGSDHVKLESITVSDSGSRNARKHNNTTGGILLEASTTDFEVIHCELKNIRGNAIWTHAYSRSPQNARGRIAQNRIQTVGRDAIQVGHGNRVTVEENAGAEIGFPAEEVDPGGGATPAALDTAGNTEQSVYRENRFEEVNGKCIDLDGFHDGEVRSNSCVNRQPREAYPDGNFGIAFNNANPNMQSQNVLLWGNTVDGFLRGGILLIGSGHRITNNHLLRLNLARCNDSGARYACNYFPNEPDFLRSGIYLRPGNARRALTRDNTIEENEVNGFGMGSRCVVAAPGLKLEENRVGRNDCSDDAPVSASTKPGPFGLAELWAH